MPPPASSDHAFLWEDGVLTDLGTLGGSYSIARDINDAGQVVGGSFTGGVPGGAFLWQDGVMSDLGALGFSNCEALGINSEGSVVGYCNLDPDRPILWENDAIIDLTALIEDSVWRANAINNTGQILLFDYVYDTVAGTGAYLEDLLPPDSAWSDLVGRDLNDAGQIVGYGTIDGFPHAFLMTPPPPIPTLSGWGAVLMILALLTGATIVFERSKRNKGALMKKP